VAVGFYRFCFWGRRGKSGQQRAPCFRKGRTWKGTESATENYRLFFGTGKGENAG